MLVVAIYCTIIGALMCVGVLLATGHVVIHEQPQPAVAQVAFPPPQEPEVKPVPTVNVDGTALGRMQLAFLSRVLAEGVQHAARKHQPAPSCSAVHGDAGDGSGTCPDPTHAELQEWRFALSSFKSPVDTREWTAATSSSVSVSQLIDLAWPARFGDGLIAYVFEHASSPYGPATVSDF